VKKGQNVKKNNVNSSEKGSKKPLIPVKKGQNVKKKLLIPVKNGPKNR
jgi:hypothetical protein